MPMIPLESCLEFLRPIQMKKATKSTRGRKESRSVKSAEPAPTPVTLT